MELGAHSGGRIDRYKDQQKDKAHLGLVLSASAEGLFYGRKLPSGGAASRF